ncbi:uncharacterized protein LOC113352503 [Papaver somniferum]|uniref:uncharacterized protein LOC113352503 n=1 Tax=Papaver somniferum TaxID=3469 RepID=UPI000E6F7818|nr:uncharacterized protein LOC113352503 [Papaver somniferum]
MADLDHTGSSSRNVPFWAQDVIKDIISRNIPDEEDGFETHTRDHDNVPKSKKEEIPRKASGEEELEYLGHIITAKGVAADPSKAYSMLSWPTPTSLKEMRGFPGLTGYYRKFVKGCGSICKLLDDLLKKNAFLWNEEAKDAFQELKETLCKNPVLALPDFSKPFILEADACARGVGVVLTQEGKPIAFFSKPLGPKSLGFSTYEKELLSMG